jgi:predicted RNA-binding protein with RPS1 domain
MRNKEDLTVAKKTTDFKKTLKHLIETADPNFQRGELKKIFEEVSQKHGHSVDVIRNFYYRNLRNEIEKTPENIPIEADVSETVSETETKPDIVPVQVRPISIPYKINQEVKVRITHVVAFGVFVETEDEYRIKGLIHISEITNTFIKDPGLYFNVNDITKARVSTIERDGKISFSTKTYNLQLKTYAFNPVLENPAEAKEAIVERFPEPKNNNELEGIIRHLNMIVGAISPKAKEKLNEMIHSYGVFQFTIAMMKSSEQFQYDPSLLFLNEVEIKMRDGL